MITGRQERRLNVRKRGVKLPKVLSRKDVDKLLDAPDNPRDKAILSVLYSCGLRVSELCNLQWGDVNFDSRTVRVRMGKGSKDRITPIGQRALMALVGYGWDVPDHDYLIFEIDRTNVWRMVKKYAKQAEIKASNISPHTLRHTFATHLLDGGANLRAIQELLGHARLETTTVYTHVAQGRMKRVHGKYHPRG